MSDNNPLISIIIPVYNAEKYIEATLDSICNQSYKNLEIIVSDDASTDSSVEVVSNYIKKDDRVKIIKNKENHGQGRAKRIGIDVCRGDIISFVDSDDLLLPGVIEKTMKLMVDTDSDITCFGFCSGTSDSGYEYYVYDKPYVITGIDAVPAMLEKKGLDSNSWGKLYKKNLYDNLEFDEGPHENISVTWRVLSKAAKVCVSGILGYVHTIRDDQVTAGYYRANDWTFITLTLKLIKDIEKQYPQFVKNAKHFHQDAVKFTFCKMQCGGKVDSEKYHYVAKTYDDNFFHYLHSAINFRDAVLVFLLRIRLFGFATKIISFINRKK